MTLHDKGPAPWPEDTRTTEGFPTEPGIPAAVPDTASMSRNAVSSDGAYGVNGGREGFTGKRTKLCAFLDGSHKPNLFVRNVMRAITDPRGVCVVAGWQARPLGESVHNFEYNNWVCDVL
jgi:hypothetical protein